MRTLQLFLVLTVLGLVGCGASGNSSNIDFSEIVVTGDETVLAKALLEDQLTISGVRLNVPNSPKLTVLCYLERFSGGMKSGEPAVVVLIATDGLVSATGYGFYSDLTYTVTQMVAQASSSLVENLAKERTKLKKGPVSR